MAKLEAKSDDERGYSIALFEVKVAAQGFICQKYADIFYVYVCFCEWIICINFV